MRIYQIYVVILDYKKVKFLDEEQNGFREISLVWSTFGSRPEKTGFLHMRKQRR